MMCSSLVEDSVNYVPDSINLSQDKEAADYWFECFHGLVRKFAKQAAISQKDDPTAEQRSQKFYTDYSNKLDQLREQGSSEPLTIRDLLDLNESYLRKNGFNDPWSDQKQLENNAALEIFQSRVDEIDSIVDKNTKWTELIRGVLAGNIFDWGAQVVSEILENNQKFGLKDALNKIQKRPWLFDDLDMWLKRLEGEPHKCAIIFVDNSGVDVVLGILPFARELLKQNTKVLLCANSSPALNDVTHDELSVIVNKCQCDIINSARKKQNLLIYPNGQNGPCLDMRTLPEELENAINKNETDLLVIEGMGRTLHTNLYAKFRCETLKLAVIKNKWLANRLGGDTFSVMCKYEN